MSNSKVEGLKPLKPKKLLEHYPWKVGHYAVLPNNYNNRDQVHIVTTLDVYGEPFVFKPLVENNKLVYCSTNY